MAQVMVRDHRVDDGCGAEVQPSIAGYGPSYGPAGTFVTIRGQNFMDGMKVMYGDALIAPSRLTASEIEFAIPRYGADASIALVSPEGRTQLAVGAFDVRAVEPQWRDDDRDWRDHDRDWRDDDRDARGDRASRLWERRFLISAKAKAEISLHERRLSRMQRTLFVLRSRGNERQIYRLELAITKENDRHRARMAQLRKEFRYDYNKKYRGEWRGELRVSL